MLKKIVCISLIVFFYFSARGAFALTYQPMPGDLVSPEGLPSMVKWMLDSSLSPADWLNQKYDDKNIQEPINIIIVDNLSSSPDQAKKKLIDAVQSSGYKIRWGHTSGYQGYIAGALYPQLPEEKDNAFSDEPFEIDNNHGRIFGPCFAGGGYYFIGAFSREIATLNKQRKHQYGSFNRARDDFAGKLDKSRIYKIKRFVNLNNAIVDHPSMTTGDHDGIAVLLIAAK